MDKHRLMCGVARLVDLESPFAGDVEENLAYARACMADSLKRGEFPLASHLLYTQEGILDDDIPEERTLGINAGKEWAQWADTTVVYCDKGISSGMEYGIKDAKRWQRRIVYRYLNDPSKDTEVGCTSTCDLYEGDE